MASFFKTIVGGRPRTFRPGSLFSRKLEVLIKKAKVDKKFRKFFLQDPAGAVQSQQLDLSETEKNVLSSIPPSILKSSIEHAFVEKHYRKTYLNKNPALILALLLSSGAIAAASTNPDMDYVEPGFIIEKDIQKFNSPAAIPDDDFTVSPLEWNDSNMNQIQIALEAFRADYNTYPSTESWEHDSNPLVDYLPASTLFDPWGRKYHYEAVVQDGQIVNYYLESLGENPEDPADNIPCSIDPEKHSFPAEADE